MLVSHETEITRLFIKTFEENVDNIDQLPLSGSSRLYFRLSNKFRSVIAAYNPDKKENDAFLHISDVLSKIGIAVPEIYSNDIENHIYLQEDLGDETLFDYILKHRNNKVFSDELTELYKTIVEQLVRIQIVAGNQMDYTICYPRAAFDIQSMMWDLNYFKYQFLKYTDVKFDEQLLENDFQYLINFLSKADSDFFLYRDFQSRNIMLHNNKPYFIDFQGGRKGALQYDIASLLFDSKAQIPEEIRETILQHYIRYASQFKEFNVESFKKYYPGFVLIRLLQAFGAYGYRGLYEKKQLFIDSIQAGLHSLIEFLSNSVLLDDMPELKRVLSLLPESQKLKSTTLENKLNICVKSFSFKRGIPYDETGNGGGHVFDCRFINNPGRIDSLKEYSGREQVIIDFIEKQVETLPFLESVKQIVTATAENYIARGFKNLSINFGCTGGRHRSVYFAEKVFEYLKNEYDVNVKIIHTEGV